MGLLFSVVIPTFNRSGFLAEALASVWAQSFDDYEVIVVDDGSTDGTREYLCGLGRVRVINQARQGPGVARNTGVANAAGQYVAFLDSDDLWFPWTLEVFAQLIQQHNRPSILAARTLEFTNQDEPIAVRQEPINSEWFPDFLRSAGSAFSVGSGTLVVKRSLFLQHDGFTTLPINCEDHDLILRMGGAPGFVQVLAPVTLGRRRHTDNLSVDLDRWLKGAAYLLVQEGRSAYPGGPERAIERRQIIARHLRPVTLACVRCRKAPAGARLYLRLFGWHLQLRQWKYLAGFPLVMAWRAISRREVPGGA